MREWTTVVLLSSRTGYLRELRSGDSVDLSRLAALATDPSIFHQP
jgi:hypothetical protein